MVAAAWWSSVVLMRCRSPAESTVVCPIGTSSGAFPTREPIDGREPREPSRPVILAPSTSRSQNASTPRRRGPRPSPTAGQGRALNSGKRPTHGWGWLTLLRGQKRGRAGGSGRVQSVPPPNTSRSSSRRSRFLTGPGRGASGAGARPRNWGARQANAGSLAGRIDSPAARWSNRFGRISCTTTPLRLSRRRSGPNMMATSEPPALTPRVACRVAEAVPHTRGGRRFMRATAGPGTALWLGCSHLPLDRPGMSATSTCSIATLTRRGGCTAPVF